MTFEREALSIDRWPAIHVLLEPALEFAATSAEEVIDGLLDGRFDLWVKRNHGLPSAVCLTETFPEHIDGFLVAGEDVENWLDELIATVTAAVGITRIRINGRLGWQRVLGKRGFRARSVIMERG